MYSHYMDGKFVPLEQEASKAPEPPHEQQDQQGSPQHSGSLLGEVTGGLSHLLGNVVKQFSVDSFDTGDILLVLIILFLFLEGDNLEVVITLGLMLLFGLNDT